MTIRFYDPPKFFADKAAEGFARSTLRNSGGG